MPELIYLARHATPDWTRKDIPYFTPPGPPLSPQGQSEAEELGNFLKQVNTRHILASPMLRTEQTAAIAAQAAAVPFRLEGGLIEWIPGEPPLEVKTRVWPVWEQARAVSRQQGPLALITHGGPISLLLTELGLTVAALEHHKQLFDHQNPVPPAGAWEITRPDPETAWQLRLVFTPARYAKAQWV